MTGPSPAHDQRSVATSRSVHDLIQRAGELGRRRTPGSRRVMLGIAGAPGAGKTMLAEELTAALALDPPPGRTPAWVAHVPMDGFHLADRELRRLGRLERKGAPDTFDAHGYAALLQRLAHDRTDTVYAPAFERDLEQALAGAIPVEAECEMVICEGNYLLLDAPGWLQARCHLDEVWFCLPSEEQRRAALVERHMRFGKTRQAARRWVDEVDEANAAAVRSGAPAADLLVQLW